MKNQKTDRGNWERPMTEAELRKNSGGGWIDVLAGYLERGVSYCYQMGLSEALHYRKMQK